LPLASPSRSSLLRSLDVSSSSLLLHELSSSSLSRAALSSSSFARFADKRAARSHLARSEGTPDGTWVGHMAQPCQENVVAIGVVADEHQSMSGVEEIQQESHSDRRTEGWPMHARVYVDRFLCRAGPGRKCVSGWLAGCATCNTKMWAVKLKGVNKNVYHASALGTHFEHDARHQPDVSASDPAHRRHSRVVTHSLTPFMQPLHTCALGIHVCLHVCEAYAAACLDTHFHRHMPRHTHANANGLHFRVRTTRTCTHSCTHTSTHVHTPAQLHTHLHTAQHSSHAAGDTPLQTAPD
jgi:hypothetical protein